MPPDAKTAPLFSPVRPIHAYERIVEQIEDAILHGRIGPNDRLPSERELMREFQVGRSTVREALRVLQSKGLVRSRPGDPNGPLVLPFSTEGLRTSMYSLARVEQLTLRELLQFRMVIEGNAYRLAAHLRTDEHLDALERALTAMWEAIPAGEEAFTDADLAYHDVVASATDNKLLSISIAVVRDIVARVVRAKIVEAADREEQMRESCRRHRLVLDAVRDRDGARAAGLARRNLFEYYGGHLDDADRRIVATLLDADGGAP
jgi:DNA-binding FadR family transcriptional regulator